MEPPSESADRADTGGRVERTGIVLVHQGEYIGPDAPSTAQVGPSGAEVSAVRTEDSAALPTATVSTNESGEVHYWFPIEIEVVGDVDGELVDQVVARVFDELQQELASRG